MRSTALNRTRVAIDRRAGRELEQKQEIKISKIENKEKQKQKLS